MTDIDPQADVEFDPAADHLTVRVPLVGPVTSEWLDCYQKLARATKVPAQVQAHRDRPWIAVRVPGSSDEADVAATLDAACALIAEADATMQPSATAKPEAIVREWWAGRRGNAPGRPVSGLGGVRVRAERRWPMACTLVLAMAVPLLLPARFSLGQPWAVPTVEALLLVAIIAIDRGRIDRRSAPGRALSLVLVAVLVVDAAWVTGRLIVDLVKGGPETNSAEDLLKTGFLVWLYTIGRGSTLMCSTPSGVSMSNSASSSSRIHSWHGPSVNSSDASQVKARPMRSPDRSRPVRSANVPSCGDVAQ
jgi:hypothetical protein